MARAYGTTGRRSRRRPRRSSQTATCRRGLQQQSGETRSRRAPQLRATEDLRCRSGWHIGCSSETIASTTDTEGGDVMKKVLTIALALLLGLAVTGAWAEEVSGKIKTVDSAQRAVVLEDGTMIWIAEGVAMEDLQEGKSVKASYEERDGKKIAVSVEVSE